MSSLFEIDLKRFAEKAQGNIDLVVRKVAFEVFRKVIQKSPVDTGRFKSNWQVSIGSIPSGTLKSFDKSGGQSIARVAAETLQFRAGQVIYLVNNLPYSLRLEYGHSKQAPGGMVRITVLEFNAIIQGIKK